MMAAWEGIDFSSAGVAVAGAFGLAALVGLAA